MEILIPFLIGLIIMLFLMIKTKIGPFMSMLIGAMLIGIACGVSTHDTISTITKGFGSTCANIGIVIIFGTILGEYLEKTNATQRIATSMLKFTGNDKSDVALSSTGFIVSIPVFADVALIMLAPIAKAVAVKSKKNVGPLAVILALSLLTTNAFVAPTPAPLAVATILEVDIGLTILWGLVASVATVLACWIFCRFYLEKQTDDYWIKSGIAEEEEAKEVQESEMPNFIQATLPILVPILLILLHTSSSMMLPKGSPILEYTSILGDKNVALVLGIFTAIALLWKRLPKDETFSAMTHALVVSGPIIFITASGGALSKVIEATGAGPLFANILAASPLSIILIPFLIAGFSKFVQGSASVAVIMAATLTMPLIEANLIHPMVAFIAINAGSQFGSHVNNSFFWVFANLFGYDTKTTLKTLCVGQHVASAAGLAVAYGMSIFM